MASGNVGRFGAVVTAMITPFDDEGGVDLDGAANLARWLVANGSDGLVIAGTTGESPVLSDREMLDLCKAVSEAVNAPVIAGTGTNDTRHSVERTRMAQDVGVDAVLVVTPYYSRPSQAGLAAHFEATAAATNLPVMLYDIPGRTGRKIYGETMLQLARDVANIVAVKDAAGDVPGSARLVAHAPPGFEVYSGDDSLTLALLAVGAHGVVSVASNWAPRAMREMVETFSKGEAGRAQVLNAKMIESYDFESTEEFPNPLPAKAACRALGLPAGQCRLPLGPAPSELDERAAQVLRNLDDGGAGGSLA